MFEKIQKLRETKGKEKETLLLINKIIIKLFWERALTYQHLKEFSSLENTILEAKSYIDKYKIKEELSTYNIFQGKINDHNGKFKQSALYYKKAIIDNKYPPRKVELEGHLAYALIMSGKSTSGLKLAVKALKDIDSKKVYMDLKKKDYYTWAVWKSGIVVRAVAGLIVKKVKFDSKLINKWVETCEKELKVKSFDFTYRMDEIKKLKQELH